MKREPLNRWHGAHHYSDKTHLLLVAFIFFVVFTLVWSYFTLSNIKIKAETKSGKPTIEQTITAIPTPTLSQTPTQGKTACTLEAKLCPDGKTYVGRTGPNCEFSKCP